MDDIVPTSPLDPSTALLTDDGAGHLTEETFTTMMAVRARPEAVWIAENQLGMTLPTVAGTATRAGGRTAIWMGPDEWLVLDRIGSAHALETALRFALSDGAGTAVDVTGQRTALRLRAPWARDLLAAGCALDLHPSVFGPDYSAPDAKLPAAQTTLAQAGVILIGEHTAGAAPGEDFTILVRTTFARYLADWMADAAIEHVAPA